MMNLISLWLLPAIIMLILMATSCYYNVDFDSRAFEKSSDL